MKALVTGACGQLGYYLCAHLVALGYQVTGLTRRQKIDPEDRVDGVVYKTGDVQDASLVYDLLVHEAPDEVYNLAAEAFVPTSWTGPWIVFQINTQGVLNFLETIVRTGLKTRFYQAGSSEMFGDAPPPQNEDTPLRPLSPYAASKAAAFHLVRQYRMGYEGLFACNGICFNSESPRRLPHFVTRHVTQGVAAIAQGWETAPQLGRDTALLIGSLNQVRDWGHARDTVRAMHLMLQRPRPDDYVIATGQGRTVQELVELAFLMIGKRAVVGENVIVTEARKRRNDRLTLYGDARKARAVLGWVPTISFERMIEEMIAHDRNLIRKRMAEVR